ncbi:putative skeletal organic matrix protein 8 [Oculina patagonica]
MDAKILLSLTILLAISRLRLTTVSGLPSATEELGSLKKDDNPTDWTVSPPKLTHQKTQSPRHWPLRCKTYTQKQLKRMLNKLGAKSYGGYNGRYMAFSWEEVRKFPNLVSTNSLWHQEVSPIPHLPLHAPKQPTSLTSPENCQTADGGLMRMCSECPTVTTLGEDKVPPYINEVTCGKLSCSGKESVRLCKNAIMLQQIYYKTEQCDSHTGYEELKPYTQEIRVCCKCMVIP